MTMFSQSASAIKCLGFALAFTLALGFTACGAAQAQRTTSGAALSQGASPFSPLAGQWSGNGTIDLANGASEPIKCRAAYDVLDQQTNLQLNIRCASGSYNFDLRGSAQLSGGTITGSWSESTRNAAGTISGEASGDRFQVTAKGPSFTATLTMVTSGDKQSVVIQAEDAQATVKRTSITLQRAG